MVRGCTFGIVIFPIKILNWTSHVRGQKIHIQARHAGSPLVDESHEIGQPLTGVVTNGQACLEWLSADPPNAEKAKHSADRIVRDGTRAGAVLNKIRALFHKGAPEKEWLNINDTVQEVMVVVRDEARRRNVRIHTYLGHDLPKVRVDRVQVQQVVLNLMVNAMDAMNDSNVAPERL